MTVLRLDAWCPRPALYKAYRQWCQDSGKYPVSAENFNAHLRQNYPTQLEERTRRGTRGWGGIGLSTDEGEE